MNGISTILTKKHEVTMIGVHRHSARRNRGQQGQIIVIAALAMVALIGGVSLILEGGNAYAHQRVAQNAADAVANAGATVLAKRLGGDTTQNDASVLAATNAMAAADRLDSYTGYYTNVTGGLLDVAGLVTTDIGTASQVGPADGNTSIPPGTQGVRIAGSQVFGTTFARAIGIAQFTASAEAAAVAGALTGGVVLPVVFPVSMESCDGTGTSVVIDEPWRLSNPDPVDAEAHPIGQEYIVPLCKTGSGSFMILDLDPDKDCEEEVANPSSIQFYDFPVDVATDTGNDCAKKIEDAIVAQNVQGTVQMIPICDGDCVTSGGSGGTYHIIRMVAFYVDYISYSNSASNSLCELTTSPTYGTSIVQITGGNASTSCIAGWFVRYVTSGPVGSGSINNGEAVGVQLIR
jgi:hypothetical protein